MIGTGTGGLGNMRMSRDHPNKCITEIGQDTEKKLEAVILFEKKILKLLICYIIGGAGGVMVIVVGNGHGDTGSNPGR